MIKSFTEKQFLQEYSEELYVNIAKLTLQVMKTMDEFKNDDPYVYGIFIFHYDKVKHIEVFDELKDIKSIIVEADANKHNGGSFNFGIRGLRLSDEMMPDDALDSYNMIMDAKKIRDIIYGDERILYSEKQGFFHIEKYTTKNPLYDWGIIYEKISSKYCLLFISEIIKKYPNVNTGIKPAPSINTIDDEFKIYTKSLIGK